MLDRRLQNVIAQRQVEVSAPRSRSRSALSLRLPQGRKAKTALASLLLAAGLMGTLSAVPSARSWAENDATQLMVQLGLRSAPVSLEKSAGPGQTESLTRDQAARLAGFTPLIPASLPDGYAQPQTFTVYNTTPRSVWWRVVKDNGPWYSADRITLLQDPVADAYGPSGKPLDIGNDMPTEVTVVGVSGLWFRVPDQIDHPYGGTPTVSRYANILRWQRDGIRYTLTVPDGMSLGQATQIAESLH
jgi:hypothetical protein